MSKQKKAIGCLIVDDYVESCGNVFADLGLPDAEQCLAKAKLISQIDDIIKKKRLNLKQAAKILGVSQSEVSALSHGKLTRFSMDSLLKFLMALDHAIKIRIKSKPSRTRRSTRIFVLHNKNCNNQ